MASVAEAPRIESPPGPAFVPPKLGRSYRITLDQYCRMVERGVFGDTFPIFLWRGRLIPKMARNAPHVFCQTVLLNSLMRMVPDGWYVGPEEPVALADDSMPEPDIVVVRGAPRDYLHRRRTAADVALLIEVADSSLPEDQGEVLESYARDRVPIYWIVNIPGRQVEVYSDPTGPAERPGYRTTRVFPPGQSVPVVLDGREVGQLAVADLLPGVPQP